MGASDLGPSDGGGAAPPPPGRGDVVGGRYVLDAVLRSGRFGDFWTAVRRADRAAVIVKLLRPELFEEEKAVARFEREIRLLTAFEHPNLLRVLDHGRTSAGAPWIVTELHDGRLLGDVVGELSLTIDEIAEIGAQIARVLAAAHARGIVHRGLDPESVLLMPSRDGRTRVAVHDFGLAHQTESQHAVDQTTLTGAEERLGRTEYWAPEYVSDKALDERTDLYALGILLFEMATGQPPFVGSTLAVMNKHVTAPAPAPSTLSERPVPPWFDELVLALLAKDPRHRPPNAETAERALAERAWPIDSVRRKKSARPSRPPR